jgi:hypothetical protein
LSRRSLLMFLPRLFLQKPCPNGRIAEIGVQPNSRIAHGRYFKKEIAA